MAAGTLFGTTEGSQSLVDESFTCIALYRVVELLKLEELLEVQEMLRYSNESRIRNDNVISSMKSKIGREPGEK